MVRRRKLGTVRTRYGGCTRSRSPGMSTRSGGPAACQYRSTSAATSWEGWLRAPAPWERLCRPSSIQQTLQWNERAEKLRLGWESGNSALRRVRAALPELYALVAERIERDDPLAFLEFSQSQRATALVTRGLSQAVQRIYHPRLQRLFVSKNVRENLPYCRTATFDPINSLCRFRFAAPTTASTETGI